MKPGRNDLCDCGSGLKYKQCCEGRATPTQWWKYAAAGVGALIITVGFVMALMDWANREPGPPGPAPAGKVWSEEHGHWHDQAPQAGGSAPQPGGAAPPGKVWSTEHGHWHDADGSAGGGAPASAAPPPGPPPPGKIWSSEHGHWHDADGAAGGERLHPGDELPLDGTETSPAPVTEAPADSNG